VLSALGLLGLLVFNQLANIQDIQYPLGLIAFIWFHFLTWQHAGNNPAILATKGTVFRGL
jgi:hypothetical protein